MDVMVCVAWGLWLLVYGKFPVRSGALVGKDARIVGLVMILMGLIGLFVPPSLLLLYIGLEVCALGAVYYFARGDPEAM